MADVIAVELDLNNPGVLNLRWRRGQTVALTIQLRDKVTLGIIDLTGATFACIIKDESSPTNVASVTPAIALTTVINPNDGFTFELTPTQTFAMQAITYKYDLFITLSSNRRPYLAGVVTVGESITPYP